MRRYNGKTGIFRLNDRLHRRHILAVKSVLTSTGRKRYGFLPVFLQTAAEKIKITVYVSRFNVLI